MACHRVHVAFHDDDLVVLPDRLARPVQRIERASLDKNGRFSRVQVLRRCLIQRPATERHRPILQVQDRKDQPVPEHVVVPVAGAAGMHQAASRQQRRREAFRSQRRQQIVPVGRRIPQAEALGGVHVDSAPLQVLPRDSSPLRMQQLLSEESHCGFKRPVQAVALGGLLNLLRAALQAHAGPAGQRLRGLRERQAADAHHKIENVAALPAPEAVPQTPLAINVK